jgi:hypothetical protein
MVRGDRLVGRGSRLRAMLRRGYTLGHAVLTARARRPVLRSFSEVGSLRRRPAEPLISADASESCQMSKRYSQWLAEAAVQRSALSSWWNALSEIENVLWVVRLLDLA